MGTTDVRRVVKDLKGGQEYDLEIRVSSEEFVARGTPFPCWGGIRAGAIRDLKDEEHIQEAVDLARSSDGMFKYIVTVSGSKTPPLSHDLGNWIKP